MAGFPAHAGMGPGWQYHLIKRPKPREFAIFACRSRIVASCSDVPGDPPRANTSSNPSIACRFHVPTWFGWTSCLAAIRLHRSVPPQRLESGRYPDTHPALQRSGRNAAFAAEELLA